MHHFKDRINAYTKLLLSLSLVLCGLIISSGPTYAAAVSSMSIDDAGSVITYSATAGSSASTAQAIVTATTLSFTTATSLTADGNTIIVALNGFSVTSAQTLAAADLTLTGRTLEASPGTADNGVDEVSVVNGASTNNNPVITITLDNAAGPVAPSFASGAKTLVIATGQITTHATALNYAISISTSSDAGSILFYVGNENQVLISGYVDPSLSFVIRNTADTADIATSGPATCAITPNPMIAQSGTNTCGYRLKVATNAGSGYTIKYASSANAFYNGTRTMTSADGSNTPVAAASANQEKYGIVLTPGSATNGTVTRDNTNFGSTATNFYSFASTTYANVVTSTGPNAPIATDTTNTTLINHYSVIRADTPPGGYTQTVTYNVIAAF